ncbi:MAG TPA: AAA family ATPase [Candidatus Dietzia intestinipullorum]|nr:AAA family ATPase [Candidatus Dietzia intestinipullorum]
MIVWINGAFGAGKTQAAYELVRRTDRSVLCDPEIVGHGLNSMVPPAVRGDFQDLPAWRIGVRDQLAAVDSAPEHDLVVVPMTLIRPAYHEEILDHLAARGHDVRHVVLTARPATLRRRLRGRAAPLLGRGEAWALSRVDRCVSALDDDEVVGRASVRISTDHLSHDQVVEAVATAVGVSLVRPRRSAPGRRLQTLANQLRAIRP